MLMKYTIFEKIVDPIVFVFLILPVFLSNTICSGWNEGTMHGACLIHSISPIYNFLMNMLLFFAFSGIGLVLFILGIMSLQKKITRWKQKDNTSS